jgi:O-antigen/teichoic acid export membrane protein
VKPVYLDLLKQFGIYGLGQALAALASFLLLPLYTRYLSPADYGCIAILDLTVDVLGIVIVSGIAAAVCRYHFEADDEAERGRVWWTALTFVSAAALAVLVPAWVARGPLARLTLGPSYPRGGELFSLILPTLWLNSVGLVTFAYLRVRRRAGLFVALSLARLVLNIGLNVTFLVGLGLGVRGILLGNLLAGAAVTLALVGVFAAERRPYRFHAPTARSLLKFGWPLALTALCTLVMHQADRYLLRLFVGMDEVGVYSLAYTIGQGVNTLFLVPFDAIWGVAVYEIARRADRNEVFGRSFRYFASALMLVMFGVSLFAHPVLSVMVSSEFSAAADLIPIVCLAYLFFSIHGHFRVPALVAGKTVSILPGAIAAALVNLGSNLVLIPWLGPAGAAWASVLTFATFSFVGLWRYRRIDVIDYPFGHSAAVLASLVATYLAVRHVEASTSSLALSLLLAGSAWSAWAIVLLGPAGRKFLLARLDPPAAAPAAVEVATE